MSGTRADRPGLAEALSHAREGDALAVWRLDRLGRSLPNLIEVVAELERRGVGFMSLTESIDTTTTGAQALAEKPMWKTRTCCFGGLTLRFSPFAAL